MTHSQAGFPWWLHGVAALTAAVGLSWTGLPAPSALCAQAPASPMGSVEILLDGSSAMVKGLDGVQRLALARRFTQALREELERRGDLPPMGLRVYGSAASPGPGACRATRRLIPAGRGEADWEATLNDLDVGTVAPLAHALEQAAADGADTYVLLAATGDGCGGDACAIWEDIAARRRDGRRARLHVVALDPGPAGRGELLCLSRAGSGWFTRLATAGEVGEAARRLALVLRNEGLVDIRLTAGREDVFVPLRVMRPLTGEVVASFTTRGVHAVPAGMFDLVVETTPPLRLTRVMVLPGETTVIERDDFGHLLVEVLDPENEPLTVPFTVRRAGLREELRYSTTGSPLILGAGRYEVRVETGDSLILRPVEVRPGRTARVTVGGTGQLVIVVPGFERPPADVAVAYGPGGSAELRVATPAPLPAGSYRLVVHTLPVYVTENVGIEAGRTTRVELPEVGVLGLDLVGLTGPERGIPAEVYEPLTGEVYGTLLSGERRLIMPGSYRLELATVPPRDIGPLAVEPGEERVVTRGGLSRIELASPASAPVRMEILDSRGGHLAEGRGRRPSITVWPGEYRVRIWQGSELLWEGTVVVASAKSARIDWPTSTSVQSTGESS